MKKTEIENLRPFSYLDYSKFESEFDKLSTDKDLKELKQSQYDKGWKFGKECEEINIALNGTFSVKMKDSSYTSNEVIGYHAGTSELLRGFLESGAPIYVHRESSLNGNKIQRYQIAEDRRNIRKDYQLDEILDAKDKLHNFEDYRVVRLAELSKMALDAQTTQSFDIRYGQLKKLTDNTYTSDNILFVLSNEDIQKYKIHKELSKNGKELTEKKDPADIDYIIRENMEVKSIAGKNVEVYSSNDKMFYIIKEDAKETTQSQKLKI